MTRWLTPQEILALTPLLDSQGWSPINPALARVLGKYSPEGELVAFITVRLHPVVGPEWSDGSDPHAALELSHELHRHLLEDGLKGFWVVADSKFAERVCERAGLQRVESPVFVGGQ